MPMIYHHLRCYCYCHTLHWLLLLFAILMPLRRRYYAAFAITPLILITLLRCCHYWYSLFRFRYLPCHITYQPATVTTCYADAAAALLPWWPPLPCRCYADVISYICHIQALYDGPLFGLRHWYTHTHTLAATLASLSLYDWPAHSRWLLPWWPAAAAAAELAADMPLAASCH